MSEATLIKYISLLSDEGAIQDLEPLLLSKKSSELKLAVSGGSIVPVLARVFESFSKKTGSKDLKVALADERIVLPFNGSARDLNVVQIQKSFPSSIQVINVPQDKHGPFDLSLIASDYSLIVSDHLGDKPFDIVFLGVGPDGHCASLFHNHPMVQGSESVYVPVENSPKPPPARISLSFHAITGSETVVFILPFSKEKKPIFHEIVAHICQKEAACDVPALQISNIREKNGKVTYWLIDDRFLSQ